MFLQALLAAYDHGHTTFTGTVTQVHETKQTQRAYGGFTSHETTANGAKELMR